MSNKIAAIIGGGVIGGGWAARFLLHGWHVKVYDPAADAQRKIEEVLANARASLPKLSDVSLPKEGQLTFCDNLEAAVADAHWIQESVPERLDIKLSTQLRFRRHVLILPLLVHQHPVLSHLNCNKEQHAQNKLWWPTPLIQFIYYPLWSWCQVS